MSRPAGFLGEAQWSSRPTVEELAEQIAKWIPRHPEAGVGIHYTLSMLDRGWVKLEAFRIAVDVVEVKDGWVPSADVVVYDPDKLLDGITVRPGDEINRPPDKLPDWLAESGEALDEPVLDGPIRRWWMRVLRRLADL